MVYTAATSKRAKVFYMIDTKGTGIVDISVITTDKSVAGNVYGVVWTNYNFKTGHSVSITIEVEIGISHLIYFVAQTELNQYSNMVQRSD